MAGRNRRKNRRSRGHATERDASFVAGKAPAPAPSPSSKYFLDVSASYRRDFPELAAKMDAEREEAASQTFDRPCRWSPPPPDQLKPSWRIGGIELSAPAIAISGLIGAGKTTLARALGSELDVPVYYEPVANNARLKDFYADKASHAFALQIDLLNKRFSQHQRLIWSGSGGIVDRSIYEDSVFAAVLRDEGAMSQNDYDVYRDLFANMSNLMRTPDVIVHLDVSPEVALERIGKRGRSFESGISLGYLEALHAQYEAFLGELGRSVRILRVDWNRPIDVEKLARSIAEHLQKPSGIVYLAPNDNKTGSESSENETVPPAGDAKHAHVTACADNGCEGLLEDGVVSYRNAIQEMCLKRSMPSPLYKTRRSGGTEHRPVFVCSLKIKGTDGKIVGTYEGRGSSKKAAEFEASRQAYTWMKVLK